MIFDGHSDIFTDVTVRRLKGETQVLKNHHLPRLRKGNIEGTGAAKSYGELGCLVEYRIW